MKHIRSFNNFICEQFKYSELYQSNQAYKGISVLPIPGKVKYVYIQSVQGEAVIYVTIFDEKGNLDTETMETEQGLEKFRELVVNDKGILDNQKLMIKDLKPIKFEQVPNYKSLKNLLDEQNPDYELRKGKTVPMEGSKLTKPKIKGETSL